MVIGVLTGITAVIVNIAILQITSFKMSIVKNGKFFMGGSTIPNTYVLK